MPQQIQTLQNQALPTQPAAWRQDETGDGYQRVQFKDGAQNMIPIPFLPNSYNNASAGGATISANYNSGGSPIGISSSLVLTTPISTVNTGVYAYVTFQFRGRYLALICDAYYNNNANDIQGWVDGQFFSITNYLENYLTGVQGSQSLYPNFLPVDVLLEDDGPHQCEFYMPISTTAQLKANLYGYAVESRLGIPPLMPTCRTQVTTLTAGNFLNAAGSSSTGYILRKLQIYNTSAVADAITIERDGNNIYTAVALPQNTPLELDFGEDTLYQAAAAGSSGASIIRVKSANGTSFCYAQVRVR